MKKNNDSRRAVVQFHAGYKGEEEPRIVIMEDQEWTVERVLERKRISDQRTGQTHEEFTCLINEKLVKLSIYSDGRHYLAFAKT